MHSQSQSTDLEQSELADITEHSSIFQHILYICYMHNFAFKMGLTYSTTNATFRLFIADGEIEIVKAYCNTQTMPKSCSLTEDYCVSNTRVMG